MNVPNAIINGKSFSQSPQNPSGNVLPVASSKQSASSGLVPESSLKDLAFTKLITVATLTKKQRKQTVKHNLQAQNLKAAKIRAVQKRAIRLIPDYL
tara:strand:- start:84654 stop:84944 length:291 start_codon:yes stop_codon:yes gene_type:complete